MAMTTSYCPRDAARKRVSAGCGPLMEMPAAAASDTRRPTVQPRELARGQVREVSDLLGVEVRDGTGQRLVNGEKHGLQPWGVEVHGEVAAVASQPRSR